MMGVQSKRPLGQNVPPFLSQNVPPICHGQNVPPLVKLKPLTLIT